MTVPEKISKNPTAKTTVRQTLHRRVGFAAVVFVGAVLSALSFLVIRNAMEREALAEFQRAFQDRVTMISLNVEQRVNILRHIAGLYAASDDVSRDEFRAFVASQLEDNAGIQALEWIPRVLQAEREAYEALAAGDFPDFRITERGDQGSIVPAAQREEYFPVYYVEPIAGNEAAVGFDLASNAVRKEALEKSRDAGEPLASGRITLVQEKESQHGFLIFYPVYAKGAWPSDVDERRRSLHGFALGVFRIGDVVNAALERLEPRGVSIRISDITDAQAPKELHTHVSRLSNNSNIETVELASGPFNTTAAIEVAGRTWTIAGYGSSQHFSGFDNYWQAWAILVGGILVSVLLAIVFLILMQRSSDVRQLVDIRTQELSESRRRLKAIFDNAADGIITIDRIGTIQSVNPAANTIFRYQPGELEGRNVKILAASPDREKHDSYLAKYLGSEESKILGSRREVEGRRRDGSTFPVELMTTELSMDSERLFLGITRDITERKEVERMKDEFVSTVSHELRTPLTVILGYLPLLTSTEEMPAPTTVAQIAGKMEAASKHLLSLVNDLLDLSKIEAGKLTLDLADVNLAEVVEEVTSELEQMAEDKGVGMEVDVAPCRVLADRVRLRQALINLLGNAVKFTEEGGVRIHVAADPGTGVATISISDTGPGIPPDQQNSIFERFKQVDSSPTRSAGGTGLGLAITKNLVKLHGGSIRLDNSDSEGSTFIFTIPLAEQKDEFRG